MKDKFNCLARLTLGLIFFVFGLNGFLGFIPLPEHPEAANAFLAGLGGSSYFFPVMKVCEVACGALLLIGRFVPLALVILAPIVVQINLIHFFLDPAGLPLGLFIGILQAYLGFFAYKAEFALVLRAK